MIFVAHLRSEGPKNTDVSGHGPHVKSLVISEFLFVTVSITVNVLDKDVRKKSLTSKCEGVIGNERHQDEGITYYK